MENSRARNIVFRITLPEDPVLQDNYPLLDPGLWPDCTYCVYQLEIGDETSRLHYQGYMEFTGVKRWAWLHRNCDGLEPANFFVRRGTQAEAINYAMKSETKVDGPWEWGRKKESESGKRTDLLHVKRAIDDGQSMAYVADNFFGTFLRYNKGLKEYKRIKTGKRDWPMELVFIIGPTGTRKSKTAREMAGDDVYWMGSNGKWWEDYEGQHTVVWDEFYGHSMPYSLLLRLLDRYPLKLEMKGSSIEFCSKRIIFTSNQEPEQWYNAERTHQMVWAENPLNRRIQEFGRIIRTGQVHRAVQQPIHWDGEQYIDLDNPNINFMDQ